MVHTKKKQNETDSRYEYLLFLFYTKKIMIIIFKLTVLAVSEHILEEYQKHEAKHYLLKASNGKKLGSGLQLRKVSRHFDDMIESKSLLTSHG